jgi:hypothetical protein
VSVVLFRFKEPNSLVFTLVCNRSLWLLEILGDHLHRTGLAGLPPPLTPSSSKVSQFPVDPLSLQPRDSTRHCKNFSLLQSPWLVVLVYKLYEKIHEIYHDSRGQVCRSMLSTSTLLCGQCPSCKPKTLPIKPLPTLPSNCHSVFYLCKL